MVFDNGQGRDLKNLRKDRPLVLAVRVWCSTDQEGWMFLWSVRLSLLCSDYWFSNGSPQLSFAK